MGFSLTPDISTPRFLPWKLRRIYSAALGHCPWSKAPGHFLCTFATFSAEKPLTYGNWIVHFFILKIIRGYRLGKNTGTLSISWCWRVFKLWGSWRKRLLTANWDRQPQETESAQWFEEIQQDLESRGKKCQTQANKAHVEECVRAFWNTRKIEHTQNLIDRMPKVMEAIIEVEGRKSKYWI